MVQGIQGDGGLTPSQIETLHEQYKQAALGFQAALDKYSQLDLVTQKDGCKDVMAKYMEVMQHVAADLHRQKLLNQTQELAADLQALGQSDAGTSKIQADLDKAKNGE